MAVSEDVKVRVSADTGPGAQGFQKLKKEIDDVGKAAQGMQLNLDNVTGQLLKFNQGLAAVQNVMSGVKGALDMAKFAGDFERLSNRVGSALVGNIQEALNGTVSQMDIMREVSKATVGELKLTEEQMISVFQAAKILGQQGFGETTELAKQFFEAIRKGQTDELKKYGITVDSTTSKTDQLRSVMQQLHSIARDGGPINEQAEAVDRAAAQIQDAADRVKVALGQIVSWFVGFGEEIGEFAASLLGYKRPDDAGSTNSKRALRAAEAASAQFMEETGFSVGSDVVLMAVKGDIRAAKQLPMGTMGKLVNMYQAAYDAMPPDSAKPLDTSNIKVPEPPKKKSPGKRGPRDPVYTYQDQQDYLDQIWADVIAAGREYAENFRAEAMERATFEDPDFDRRLDRDLAMAGIRLPGRQMDVFGRNKLQKSFGSDALSEGESGKVQAELQKMGVVSQTAVGLTSDATGALIAAAIDGQENILKATRRAIAGSLKARSIQFGAESVGALAMGFLGDPTKFAAAGKLAAAAAGFGAAARLLGESAPSANTNVAGGGYAMVPVGGNRAVNNNFYVTGSAATNAIEFQKSMRRAAAQGMIPGSAGPSRFAA